ncbi:6-carboxytetrahydropterin synthase, partial [Sulfurihydrogenibium sp.]
AKYFYDYLAQKLKEANLEEDIKVVQITLWETATSKATYKGE